MLGKTNRELFCEETRSKEFRRHAIIFEVNNKNRVSTKLQNIKAEGICVPMDLTEILELESTFSAD